MKPINNNIDILSDAEYAALYEKPEFNDEQRIEYLTLTDDEIAFAMTRRSLGSTAYPGQTGNESDKSIVLQC